MRDHHEQSGSLVTTLLRRPVIIAAALFALLTLAMFGDVLVNSRVVLGDADGDMAMQFLPWRDYGFSQMRGGDLPLWNPHLFSGTPYLATFQSALLYPPNWLHLLLPLGVAINVLISLHVFLMGQFTYAWARYRGVSAAGAVFSGVAMMFSGPYFLHIIPGHLPHLAVMVWIPLLFLAVDGLSIEGRWRWALLGAVALAMQILAGHPQYVYYSGIMLAVYGLMNLCVTKHRWMLIGGGMAMMLGSACLSAVQLLPGIEAASENVRQGGLPFIMARMYSLPPEDWLGLIGAYFFGDMKPVTVAGLDVAHFYFGRNNLWEMSPFVGLSTLVLAGWAGWRLRGEERWISLAMVAIAAVLAMGRFTPVYGPMYAYFPGYGSFRCVAKFLIFVAVFLSLLAGMGFDLLMVQARQNPRGMWRLVIGLLVLVLLASVATIVIYASNVMASMVEMIVHSGELIIYPRLPYEDEAFLSQVQHAAGMSMMLALATLLILVMIAAAMRYRAQAGYGLVLLVMVEMFLFARSTRATMPVKLDYPATWAQVAEIQQDQQRVLHLAESAPNQAMNHGLYEMWGYDPGVLDRYAQLISYSQGIDPDEATQYVGFQRTYPFYTLYRMFRLSFILQPVAEMPVARLSGALPHALLISRYRVLSDRDEIFATLTDDHFDPAAEVILEKQPPFESQPGPVDGQVRLINHGPDEMEIEAELSQSAMLLVTDNFARGWHVRPLEAGGQSDYTIEPANYTLRGIALQKGRHHFMLVYAPLGFIVGRWISCLSLALLAVAVFYAFWLQRGGRDSAAAGPSPGSARPSPR